MYLNHLIKLNCNTGTKSGIGSITQLMGQHRIDYWDDDKSNHCRLVLAKAYKVADEFAEQINLPMEHNILPILHFLLYSLIDNHGSTRIFPAIDRTKLFLPPPRLVELMIEHEYTWRTDKFLLPVSLRPVGPDIVVGAARGTIAESFWPSTVPGPATCKMKTFHHRDTNRCINCGILGHELKTCNLIKNGVCSYPLCRQLGHNIMVCPIMHGLCQECGLRGHEPLHHRHYPLIILEEVFLQHCHRGLFTSVIFLEYIPRYHQLIEERHWRLSLYNRRRCDSNKLFFRLGMEYTMLPSERLSTR